MDIPSTSSRWRGDGSPVTARCDTTALGLISISIRASAATGAGVAPGPRGLLCCRGGGWRRRWFGREQGRYGSAARNQTALFVERGEVPRRTVRCFILLAILPQLRVGELDVSFLRLPLRRCHSRRGFFGARHDLTGILLQLRNRRESPPGCLVPAQGATEFAHVTRVFDNGPVDDSQGD